MQKLLAFIMRPSLLVIFTVFSILCFSGLAAVSTYYLKVRESENLRSSLSNQTSEIAYFFAAVSDIDGSIESANDRRQRLLDTIIETYPNTKSVWIELPEEGVRLEANAPDRAHTATTFERSVPIQALRGDALVTIGTFNIIWEMSSDFQLIEKRVDNYVTKQIYMAIIIFCAFVLFGYFAVHRPLRFLRDYQEDLLSGASLSTRKSWNLVPVSEFFELRENTDNFATRLRDFIRNRKEVKAIFDTALDCVISINKRGDITHFNKAAENTFGYSRSEAIGSHMASMIVPEHLRDAHEKGMQHYFNTGEQRVLGKRIEIVALRKSGEEFPVELTITEIKVRGEVGFTAYLRDISDRKALEASLTEAKEAAEDLSSAKSNMLATVSHELKTPLTALRGSLSLLGSHKSTGNTTDLLEKSIFSADLLRDLIDNILDFSKLEAGKIALQVGPFDVRELISTTADIIEPLATRKNNQFKISVAEDIPTELFADSGRIRQVLLNLLSNANKHTQAGLIELLVKTLPVDTGKLRLRFEVRDEGQGISKDDIGQIFDDFFSKNTGANSSESPNSTGLGLSISKRLVDIMDGTIGVISELGRGSLFWFEIPVISATGDDDTSRLSTMTHPELEHFSAIKGKDILIVEDNQTNALIIETMINKLGATCLTANSGLEAIELVKRNMFDFILLDISMPEMDGFETLKKFQELSGFSVPVIAMTAHALPEIRKRAFAAGMQSYIQKPVSMSDLRSVLGSQAHNYSIAPGTDPAALIVASVFNELFKNAGLTVFEKMIVLFEQDSNVRMNAIKAALNEGDLHIIERESHSLAGSAASYGLGPLTALLKEFELNSLNANRDFLDKNIQRLETLMIDSKKALRHLSKTA